MSIKIDPDLLNELIKLGDRLSEDRLYEIAVSEVEDNQFDGVAKAKALEEAEGDQNKARAFYTKHRVRRIRDLIAEQALMAEASRVQAEEERVKAEEERVQAEKQRIREEKERVREENFGKGVFKWYLVVIVLFVVITLMGNLGKL